MSPWSFSSTPVDAEATRCETKKERATVRLRGRERRGLSHEERTLDHDGGHGHLNLELDDVAKETIQVQSG